MNLKTLVSKIRAKTNRVFARCIPFNTRYRPSGIVSVRTSENGNGIEYIALNGPYKSSLTLPDDLKKSLSSYIQLFTEVSYPGNYIIRIKQGRLLLDTGSNMAIVSGRNKLIDEVSFQWNADKVLSARQNVFLKQKGFKRPTYFAGTVFSLLAGGGAKTYFYHWMVDSASRLGLLQQSGLFNTVDYFLVPNYALPYQAQFLEHFGIKKNRVINGANMDHLQADTLIVSSYTVIKSHHPQWMCDWLYHSLISPGDVRPTHRLIYVARGDTGRNRKVLNEREVISALKHCGFEIHFLSRMSVKDQARLFNSSRVVVAPHGAGLTNLVFCQPGTRVLELFPDAYVRHVFWDISSKRGLDYHFLLCPADDVADSAVEGQKINLVVDIGELIEKTNEMMKRT